MSGKKYETYGFGRINLIILIVSIVLIVLGFVLMSGGASVDGVSFNEATFSPMRITVAPVVTTIGYLGVLISILWRSRPKGDESADGETDNNI